MSKDVVQTPASNFTVHPSASSFTVNQQKYLDSHLIRDYECIGTGVLVFDTQNLTTPRILLLQRSASDSMPNRWEVPGGACDEEDESILHGAVRELWEESGLKAESVAGPVGEPHFFMTSYGKRVCKFNFLVEVERNADGRLEPKLDPVEHQRFLWASEAEVRSKKVQDVELVLTMKAVEDTILQGFAQLKSK